MQEADIRAYLRIVCRNIKWILLGTFACIAIAIFIAIYTPPLYESSTIVLVSERQPTEKAELNYGSYEGLLMSERLAKTYSEMMLTQAIAAKVVKRLGLKVTPTELTSRIAAEPVQDTNLIKLTATDKDPLRAQRIAGMTVKVFSEELSGFKSMNDTESPSGSHLIKVNVVEPATLPTKPVRPKPLLNVLLATLVGAIASSGVAVTAEYLDVSIKSSEDLERAIDVPVLGSIPRSSTGKGLEVISQSSSMAAEAYRSLRTNLQYFNFDGTLRVIAIASAVSGEGKTTVACNLAAVMAESGKRVMLLSCDLRRPRVHELFRIPNDVGLSHVLIGLADLDDVLVTPNEVGRFNDRLKIVTSGPIPPNPVELLSSRRMAGALKRAKEIADAVILDCPPVIPVTDAAVLAPLVDGFLLVAQAGKTDRNSIVRALDALGKVSARVLGSVLNCSRPAASYGYSYGYSEEPRLGQKQAETEKGYA